MSLITSAAYLPLNGSKDGRGLGSDLWAFTQCIRRAEVVL